MFVACASVTYDTLLRRCRLGSWQVDYTRLPRLLTCSSSETRDRDRRHSLNLPIVNMGYSRVKGPSLCLLLHIFSVMPVVSLAHAGFMRRLFPGYSSKADGPHIGPSKRDSVNDTTLWVIEDTYEGQSFFECVDICFSFETSSANGVVPSSTFDFYTGVDPTKFAYSLLREFIDTDTRSSQRIGNVSPSVHESISNKASPSFVDEQTAFADGLAYVTSDNKVIMKGDNTTWLAEGVNRSR